MLSDIVCSVQFFSFSFFFFNLFLSCGTLWWRKNSKTFHPLAFMKEVCGGKTTQIPNDNMPFNICGAKLRIVPAAAAALNRRKML